MTDLTTLRHEIEKFTQEIRRESYMHFSGQKDKLEIKALYNKFGFLFSKDLTLEMKDMMNKAVRSNDEDIRRLFNFVMFGWIGESLKELSEEQANTEAELKISFDGEDIPYRNAPVKIVNLSDSDQRKELYMKKVEVDVMLNEKFHIPRWEKTWEMVSSMGFGPYLDTMEKLQELDYRSLSSIMNKFIDDTETLYVDVFDKFAQDKVGKPLNECGYWDAGYMFRGKDHDEFFPADKLVPTLTQFFSDFGFPLDQVPAIILDVEDRPKKVPRAFCAAVKIREEVYINLQPVGGNKDYTTLLHEAGHAYHYAFANPDQNMEFNRLGDRAISEGFAFLFNYLPENPEWCKRYLKVDDPSGIVYSELRQKLFFLRRYGAKLAYEVELHKDNTLEGKDQVYKNQLQNALKFETPAENYLSDLDAGFYTADYLRAWIWEVQLRQHLVNKYGTKWFMDRNAGKEICELWKDGQKYPVETMAVQLGYDGIDIEPVKNTLVCGLS